MLRILMACLMITVLATAAAAFDLGRSAPIKPEIHHATPPANPDVLRQGGDLIADAVDIPVLSSGTGTTAGFNDDYDEECPYDSMSPEVVYRLIVDVDIDVTIDMLGSTYDTKIYVYDQDLALVACNDDFYPDYVSKIESVDLVGGDEYYLVVDGYGGDAGEYVYTITENVPCYLECPAGAQLEGEPPLVDGYNDLFNSGCGSDGTLPFSTITENIYCGRSGWYLSADGSQYRDTDWHEILVPEVGYLEIIGDAEYATYMFELGPQDCANVGVVQQATIGPCTEASMIIPGEPGSVVWFWVGPTNFDGEGEYDYVLYLNLDDPIATEAHSWTTVKSLFD